LRGGQTGVPPDKGDKNVGQGRHLLAVIPWETLTVMIFVVVPHRRGCAATMALASSSTTVWPRQFGGRLAAPALLIAKL